MEHKSKKTVISAAIAAVLLILSVLYLAFHPFVYLNGKLLSTDVTALELDYLNAANRSCYGLQYFDKLQTLRISHGYEQEFVYIPGTETPNEITLAFTSVKEPADIKALENAGTLHFLVARFDFDGFGSDKIKDLSFQSCCIDNFNGHGALPNLEELTFYNCYFDREDFSFGLMMDKSDDTQTIADTNAFAALDSVKRLCFDRIIFEDISGFLDMDSLEEIKISSDELSEENIEKLEKAGIKVIKLSYQQ